MGWISARSTTKPIVDMPVAHALVRAVSRLVSTHFRAQAEACATRHLFKGGTDFSLCNVQNSNFAAI